MKGRFKRYKAWCWNCDCQIVTGGKKCPYCGARLFANRKFYRVKVLEEEK